MDTDMQILTQVSTVALIQCNESSIVIACSSILNIMTVDDNTDVLHAYSEKKRRYKHYQVQKKNAVEKTPLLSVKK